MNVIEIKKDNYLFGMDVDKRKVYILKKIKDEIRFLYMVKLVSDSHLKEQHQYVVDTFFNRLHQLDYEGKSEGEIFKEMQFKKVS